MTVVREEIQQSPSLQEDMHFGFPGNLDAQKEVQM